MIADDLDETPVFHVDEQRDQPVSRDLRRRSWASSKAWRTRKRQQAAREAMLAREPDAT